MKQNKIVSILIISMIVIMFVFVYFKIFNINQTSINLITQTEKTLRLLDAISLPENVFDEKINIENTSVSIFYPKHGFYGLGSEVFAAPAMNEDEFHNNFLGRVTILPNQESSQTYMPVELSIGVFGINESETLKQFINTIPGITQKNGVFITINSHEFFVYHTMFGPISDGWRAISFDQKEIVDISLNFSHNYDAFSYSVFREGGQLFLQILSNLKFE